MAAEISKEAAETEEKLKEKAKKLSIAEGSAYSVQEGFGLKNITPYALALGKNNPNINAYIGFLSSAPALIGNLLQLFASRLLEKFSRKKIISTAVFSQALMWLSLIFVGFLFFRLSLNSNSSLLLLIFFYALLVVFGAFAGPAWISWMKDIVTKDSGKYFGKRNKICGSVALVSMLIAAFLLDHFKKTNLLLGFAILFFMAFIFRSISAFIFTKKYEPELKLEKEYYFSIKQFIKKMPYNNFGKFTIFISLISLATAIASPFFSVYMLKDLKFSYLQWTIVTISSSLASLFFMPVWGKFSDKYGNLKSMKISGFLVFLVPTLWLFSPLFLSHKLFLLFYLIIIESFSGMVWAGFNLTSSNFIYDAVTRQRIAICASYFNLINAAGIFIGATLGGFVSSLNFSFFSLTPILFIFLLSAIARFIAYAVMMPKIKEVRQVKEFNVKEHTKEKLKFLNPKTMLDIFNLKIIKPSPDGD